MPPQTNSLQTETPQTETPQTEPPRAERPQRQRPKSEPPRTQQPKLKAPRTRASQIPTLNNEMTTVLDPAFWRRFDVAIRMDEEITTARLQSRESLVTTTKSKIIKIECQRPPRLEHSDTWLDRHRKKRKRALLFGWVIVLLSIIFIIAILLVCLWVFKVGPFSHS